jgi:hypothetical protein
MQLSLINGLLGWFSYLRRLKSQQIEVCFCSLDYSGPEHYRQI